jgi:hypothetical protein
MDKLFWDYLMYPNDDKFKNMESIMIQLENKYAILNEKYIGIRGDNTLVFMKTGNKFIKLSKNKHDVKKIQNMGCGDSMVTVNHVYSIEFSDDKIFNNIDACLKHGFNVVLVDDNGDEVVHLGSKDSSLVLEI